MLVLLQGGIHIIRGRLDAGLAIMDRVLPKQDAREPDLFHKLAISLGLERVLDFLWVVHSHQEVCCFGTAFGQAAQWGQRLLQGGIHSRRCWLLWFHKLSSSVNSLAEHGNAADQLALAPRAKNGFQNLYLYPYPALYLYIYFYLYLYLYLYVKRCHHRYPYPHLYP